MSVVAKQLSLQVDGATWMYPFDLSLGSGSFTTVIGPAGAGKTSLLRMLAGFAKPHGGQLLVDGRDVTGVDVRRRNVGMVYQEFVNYPGQTVFGNIAAPLRNEKMDGAAIKKRVQHVAELVGIEAFLERFPLELSGGQQQRLSIARTIAKPRDLVLLDEPLVNLDYKLREHLRGEFHRLFANGKTVAVYASSEPQEALLLSGDVIVLNEGRLLQHGEAQAVYHSPATQVVARLINDPPLSILPASLVEADSTWIWKVGDLVIGTEVKRRKPLRPGRYSLGLYPHHLKTAPAGTSGLPAQIEFVEVNGSNSFVYASHDGTTLAIKEKGVHGHAIGRRMTIAINIDEALVFDVDGDLVASPAIERNSADG